MRTAVRKESLVKRMVFLDSNSNSLSNPDHSLKLSTWTLSPRLWNKKGRDVSYVPQPGPSLFHSWSTWRTFGFEDEIMVESKWSRQQWSRELMSRSYTHSVQQEPIHRECFYVTGTRLQDSVGLIFHTGIHVTGCFHHSSGTKVVERMEEEIISSGTRDEITRD